ncbi:MAG: hypothetical protein ABJC51_03685, partial [Acidobacteriota bacterium]
MEEEGWAGDAIQAAAGSWGADPSSRVSVLAAVLRLYRSAATPFGRAPECLHFEAGFQGEIRPREN